MTEKSPEAIAERAGKLAADYEKTCTGCAQSAVAGLLDPKELEEAMKGGMLEHCAGVVGRTTRRAAELILRERSFEAIRSHASG